MSLVAAAFTTLLSLWAGVMLYSAATTYPMFRDVGPGEFVETHKTYERGLPFGVYLPFSAMTLVVLWAVIERPPEISGIALWAAGVALAGGIYTTAAGAAPLHIALIRDGKDGARIERMIRWNLARAVFAAIGLSAAIATSLRG